MLTKSITIGVIALAAAGLSAGANQTTFEDLRSTTFAVRTHADAVNTIYGTAGYDWNAQHLQAIRDETNHIGQDLQKLRESSLTPNEERALDRAIPLLKTMAADTSAAIQAINEKGRPVDNNGALFNQRYHNRMVAVQANAAQAEKIFENVANFEKVRGQLESLQKQSNDQNQGGSQPQESAR